MSKRKAESASDEKEAQPSAAKKPCFDHYTIMIDGEGFAARLATNIITLTDSRFPSEVRYDGIKFVKIGSDRYGYKLGHELKEVRDGTYRIIYSAEERLIEEFTIKKGKLDGLYRFYSWPGCKIFPSYPFDNGNLDADREKILYHHIGYPTSEEPVLEIFCVFHEGRLNGAVIIKDICGAEARIEMKEDKRDGLSIFLREGKKYYYHYRDNTLYEHKIMKGQETLEWGSPGCRGSLLPSIQVHNCEVLACHYEIITPNPASVGVGETETHYTVKNEMTHTFPLLNGVRHGKAEWMQRGIKITEEYNEGRPCGQWTEEYQGKIVNLYSYHYGWREGRSLYAVGGTSFEQYFQGGSFHGVQRENAIITYYFQGEREKDLSKFLQLSEEVKSVIPHSIRNGPSDIILQYLAPLQEEIYSVMKLKWTG